MDNLRAALAQQDEPHPDYPCRSDGRCQYAIDHGAEGLGSCPKGKCAIAQPQPAEDRAVAQDNLRVMREMFGEQAEPAQDQDVEDAIEAAYWHFDARKKGLNEWASAPQSERDAFKAEARKLAKGYFPTRQVQDTKREMLAVANAFIRGKRAALAQQAEPVQEPVAWIHTDPDKPRVRFLEWREDEPGYRGRWVKTPLYLAPPRCPNCASLEAQNSELDRKLAEMEQEEREACAKVCDDKAKETFSGQCQVWGDYFARAIRARSKE
jgi:hypothetical protein